MSPIRVIWQWDLQNLVFETGELNDNLTATQKQEGLQWHTDFLCTGAVCKWRLTRLNSDWVKLASTSKVCILEIPKQLGFFVVLLLAVKTIT
jgi:hypothetical protein